MTPQSRPIPPKTKEEEIEIGTKCKPKLVWNRLTRIIGFRRMGSTLLLITCFLFYGGLSYLFGSTWPWCCGFYLTLEVVSQLLLATNLFLLFGFKALCVLLFLQFLNCWTASLGIIILVGTPALTFGCFLKWLIWDIEN